MSYSEQQKKYREDSHNHSVATKIIDLMKKLRLSPNEFSPRRWVWELMQNAKDVIHENSTVSIEINLIHNDEEGILEFRHNGKPFSVKNITFLIEQVSAKNRDSLGDEREKTTGKFGTGFLTTHLLSEKVEIESIIQEGNQPYKKFKLLLNRSGRRIEEIIESVNASHNSIKKIDSEEPYEDYSPKDYNTTFRYHLNTKGISVAQKGIEDLHNSIVFALVFLPEIESINLLHEGTKYQLDSDVKRINSDMQVFTVNKITSLEVIETKIAVLTNGDTKVATEIEYKNDRIYLKEFNSMTPRLFCDFPLIGTDSFPFPAIINSPKFNPTEPRDFIYLSDVEDEEVVENKSRVLIAKDLYLILLKRASEDNWGNIHLLATFPKLKEREDLSEVWFKREVEEPIKKTLLITPIVETEYGKRIPILNETGEPIALFPMSSNNEIRAKIWGLANLRFPELLPRKKDIDIWAGLNLLKRNQLSLEFLAKDIQIQGNLKTFESVLVPTADPIQWLNSYFQLIGIDKEFAQKIIQDEYVVIPNQNGQFTKKSVLRQDGGIEEELKNVRSILGYDYRDFLLHKEILTEKISYEIQSQEDIIEGINKILKENYSLRIDEAHRYLISLFSNDPSFPIARRKIYNFYNIINSHNSITEREINTWSEDIWGEVDKRILKKIAQSVSEYKNVEALSKVLEMDVKKSLNWLNNFVEHLVEYQFDNLLNIKQSPILPNQNGNFRMKDDLFLDYEINEELKEISADLGSDIRDDLLDANIYLVLPESRWKTQSDVANEIIRLVNIVDRDTISNVTKKAFSKLLLWFRNNGDVAEGLFRELYVHKHKLYDDEEIAANIQKAEELSGIMNEFGIEDLSILREVINESKNSNISNQRLEVTKENIVDLGVATLEEWEEAMKNTELASRFFHTSKPTKEMLDYVQELLKRAKANVLGYLENHIDYDCSEWEELSSTVIGGIKKLDQPINIVVRPSDNGIVIIYYGAEKDALAYEASELWIENGKTQPVHLTLGKILKSTGINRIPVSTSWR